MNFYNDDFNNFHYILNDSNYGYSSMCYALSRQGMKLYLDCCKIYFGVSDIVLNAICISKELYNKYKFYNISFPICESINTLYTNNSLIGNEPLKCANTLHNLF